MVVCFDWVPFVALLYVFREGHCSRLWLSDHPLCSHRYEKARTVFSGDIHFMILSGDSVSAEPADPRACEHSVAVQEVYRRVP